MTVTSTNGASPRPLRLAVLLCDTPQPKTNARYGGYTGLFKALLDASAQLLGKRDLEDLGFSYSAHDVVNDLNSYPNLDDVDVLLLTGSRHTAYEDHPWILKLVDYTRSALDTDRIRTLGICFGHQIIGRAVGAELGASDKGWEVAVTDVELTEKGKEIFEMDKMRIQQMHKDIIFNFPSDAIPLGSNSICTVQSMCVPGKYISVQGHPEFTEDVISEVLFNRHKAGIFTNEIYEDGMKRAPVPHDGIAIGKAFLKFAMDK